MGDDKLDNEEEGQSPESQEDLGLEQFGDVSDDQGISLDDLSSAYAEMMGGEDPYEEGTSPDGPADSELESMILAEDDERPSPPRR